MAIHDIIMAAAGGASSLSLTYIGSGYTGNTSTTQTVSNFSLGTGFTNRRIIVFATVNAGGFRSFTSATLDGNNMTQLASISTFGCTAAYEIADAVNSTADIELEVSGSVGTPMRIFVYSVNTPSLTLVDSASSANTSATKSLTVNTAFNGAVLMAANAFNSSTVSVSSFSGLDQLDYPGAKDGSSSFRVMGSDAITAKTTNSVYSITFNTTSVSSDKALAISLSR